MLTKRELEIVCEALDFYVGNKIRNNKNRNFDPFFGEQTLIQELSNRFEILAAEKKGKGE
jgi:hypothetical protein